MGSAPAAPDAAGAAPASAAPEAAGAASATPPPKVLKPGDTARVFYSREKAKWNDRLGTVISVDPKKKKAKMCMLEGPAKVSPAILVFVSVV